MNIAVVGQPGAWSTERLADALRAAGASVELESVPGADHFFGGASDGEVGAIFERALDFLVRLDSRAPTPSSGSLSVDRPAY